MGQMHQDPVKRHVQHHLAWNICEARVVTVTIPVSNETALVQRGEVTQPRTE